MCVVPSRCMRLTSSNQLLFRISKSRVCLGSESEFVEPLTQNTTLGFNSSSSISGLSLIKRVFFSYLITFKIKWFHIFLPFMLHYFPSCVFNGPFTLPVFRPDIKKTKQNKRHFRLEAASCMAVQILFLTDSRDFI